MNYRCTRAELASMLAGSIGAGAALERINRACSALHYKELELDREKALAVLEQIADEPGIAGISARFAKSRIILTKER
jgi:hypothetical protein